MNQLNANKINIKKKIKLNLNIKYLVLFDSILLLINIQIFFKIKFCFNQFYIVTFLS